MLEIRIHGRGGQGAKTAAQFIAEAALVENKYIQAFPEYGPERTGAPVKTYVRIAEQPIRHYTPIQYPQIVLVIDPTLFEVEPVTQGLAKDGILIVNTDEPSQAIRKKTGFGGKIYTVPGTKIALATIGKNTANTVLLGTLAKVTNSISLSTVKQQIEKHFSKKLGNIVAKANVEAIEQGYQQVAS